MNMPDDLLHAIETNSMTDEQIRQLIEIEAHELGLTYDQAVQKAKEGTLPTGPLGSDIEFLAGLFAA